MIHGFGDSGSSLIYDLGGLLAIDGIDLSFGAKYRSDNAARGGCVYTNGDLRVTDSHVYACTVHANTYDATGGALSAYGSVNLDNVIIENSGPTTVGTGKGGCVFAGSDLVITNSRISGCRNAAGTQGFGGGAYAGGNLLMKYSTIDGNENDDAPSGGGGLFVRGSSNDLLVDDLEQSRRIRRRARDRIRQCACGLHRREHDLPATRPAPRAASAPTWR